ncbi:MAG: hypothetical protein KDC27_10820 [Acidobacteria bacterium]|nr:hypothetical protein [Acidobacteriota bacterium]
MVTETHLVTELGELNVRANGPVTAGIWFATDSSGFPMVGWTDFIVVILGWWVAAILRLLREDSGTERVYFMDGPYAVEVSKSAWGRLHLRMFAGPGEGQEVATGEADVTHFIAELSRQSQKLLDECELQGWWSPDADTLALHLQNLDRELALEGGEN